MSEQNIRFQEVISSSQVLLDDDFDIEYVRNKLRKDGFLEPEIDTILASTSAAPLINNARSFTPRETNQNHFVNTDKIKNDFNNQAPPRNTYQSFGSREDARKEFASYGKREQQSPELNEKQAQIAIGLLIMIVGIVVTVFSYTAASSNPNGGTYVVAWGAIVFGAIRVFKGMSAS